jgi:hypothetical protein
MEGEALPIVSYGNLYMILLYGELYLDSRGPGMSRSIEQCLTDDIVDL